MRPVAFIFLVILFTVILVFIFEAKLVAGLLVAIVLTTVCAIGVSGERKRLNDLEEERKKKNS
jgi:hypothetical protein